jgi:hypothetical protein
MGKGSSPRPFSVSLDEFNNNFDNIFRKKKTESPDDKVLDVYNDERLVSKFDKLNTTTNNNNNNSNE